MIQDISLLRKVVRKAVETTTVTDIHRHLSPPSHGDMLLWGADEVLTYHYLVAEFFTVAPRDLTYEKFFSLPKSAQADLV
ncbi:MAG: glucuronate isomerase, partial [Phycisphaerae bacterium]|nr:glucuronate isomerase [Phycisphaerae bacterium]